MTRVLADRHKSDQYKSDKKKSDWHTSDWHKSDWQKPDQYKSNRHTSDQHKSDRHKSDLTFVWLQRLSNLNYRWNNTFVRPIIEGWQNPAERNFKWKWNKRQNNRSSQVKKIKTSKALYGCGWGDKSDYKNCFCSQKWGNKWMTKKMLFFWFLTRWSSHLRSTQSNGD